MKISVINQHLQKKYERLIEKDKAKHEVDLKKNPEKELKERKLNQHEMPTREKSFLSYELLDAYFKHSKNVDYHTLPGQVNQQVMKNCYNT